MTMGEIAATPERGCIEDPPQRVRLEGGRNPFEAPDREEVLRLVFDTAALR